MAKNKYPPGQMLDSSGEPLRTASGSYGRMGASKGEADWMADHIGWYVAFAIVANIVVLAWIFS